ncbi:MAG: hypothetical protein H3C36_08325 [Chitinophagaceae bacterium]|nr:hypothetical protein [Chitinophagaceae bacterium]MCZ2395555.1 hypothetical protein [Chitinophagales bacterium]
MVTRFTLPQFNSLFIRLFLTTIFLCAIFNSAFSQNRIVQKACFDSTLKQQADSLKEFLAQKGFIVVREATMTMESQYEMPIIVPLTDGTWYQFAFIGDHGSKLFEARMYDWVERQVAYVKNGIESNVIMFPYIPKSTEYHVLKTVQVSNNKKRKELCGYVIMFKKVK